MEGENNEGAGNTGAGGTAEGGTNVGGENEGLIPKARLDEVINQRNELRIKNAELLDQVGQGAQLRTEMEALRATADTLKAGYESKIALLTDGRLPSLEAIDIAELLYTRLPEDDRPESLLEWVKSQAAAPDEAPAALRAYLSSGRGTTTTRRADETVRRTDLPAQGDATAEKLEAVKRRAVQTGDYTEWNALVKQVQQSA